VVRTYAPCGETPVLKVFQTRDHLSVMSGISTAGHLVTLTRTRALTGQESVTFLRHLYGYLGRRLLVIWDKATIHRSDEVKAFLANGWATKIHLEHFPAYAPELTDRCIICLTFIDCQSSFVEACATKIEDRV
jgi:hypothetical protein